MPRERSSTAKAINESAFDGTVTGVTIEYLTIENFVPPNGQMVVNHDGGASWTIEYNTIAFNSGAGVGLGSNDVVEHNCLCRQRRVRLLLLRWVPSNVTLTDNEIADNNTNGTYDQQAYVSSYSVTEQRGHDRHQAPMNLVAGGIIDLGASGGCSSGWCANLSDYGPQRDLDDRVGPLDDRVHLRRDHREQVHDQRPEPGRSSDPQVTCGCSGGGKFWDTAGGTVTDNWVHGNGDVGIWADTDNSGFNISGNYIADNWGEGIIYEISYNASITDNGFVDNALGLGTLPGARWASPTPALYISRVRQRQPGVRVPTTPRSTSRATPSSTTGAASSSTRTRTVPVASPTTPTAPWSHRAPTPCRRAPPTSRTAAPATPRTTSTTAGGRRRTSR